MGCFCQNLVPVGIQAGLQTGIQAALQVGAQAALHVGLQAGAPVAMQSDEDLQTIAVVAAVADWLAARWLPAPPWQPDPEWHDVEWPDAPIEPASMAVLTALVIARTSCQRAFQIDPAEPEQLNRLARIICTLNRRTEALQQMEADRRPWAELAAWNAQIDIVQQAATQQIFQMPPAEQALGPWRQMLTKVKALAPLVAIGRLQGIDFRKPEAVEALARTVRNLRRVTLPPLDDAPLILRLVGQAGSIAQLKDHFGADPRPYPFERVVAVVRRKAEAVAATLPPSIAMRDGRLDGMPVRQPNPGQILNRDTVAAARCLTPEVLRRLRWQVPNFEDLPLLTTAAPVAALTQALSRLGPDPVRQTPCGNGCDAASAMRGLSPGPPHQARGTPGT